MRPIDAYRKRYKLRKAGATVEITVPPEVVEREARKRDLTIDEFVEQYIVVALYDAFDGVLYRFEPAPGRVELPSSIAEGT